MDERTVIEWEKDDLEALRLLKVDVLGLGMLSCLRRGFDLLRMHYSSRRHRVASRPMHERRNAGGLRHDPARRHDRRVPDRKPRADVDAAAAAGRAEFYDLVIEVAIVRPGPIQGDMVHPYLRRRSGEGRSRTIRASPEHGDGRTGRDPGARRSACRCSRSRRCASPSWRRSSRPARPTGCAAPWRPSSAIGTIEHLQRQDDRRHGGARLRSATSPQRCFNQIEGFGEYGFPESHAASFANLVYVSCWIKCHYPDVFAAALLNSQPMGFYAPAQIVRDAQRARRRGPAGRRESVGLGLHAGGPAAARRSVHTKHASSSASHDSCARHLARTPCACASASARSAALARRHGLQASIALRGGGFDSVRDLWLRTRPAARGAGAARQCRRVPLTRPRPARCALGGAGAARAGDKDDLPLFARATMPELEPDAASAADAAGRAGGRGLSPSASCR